MTTWDIINAVLVFYATHCGHKVVLLVLIKSNPIQSKNTFEIVSREKHPVRIVRQSSDFDNFDFDSVKSGRGEDLDLTVLKLLDSKEILLFKVEMTLK